VDPKTMLYSLLGGALIGLASSGLLLFHGRIAGISGIVHGTIIPKVNEWGWRVAFLCGLLCGGIVMLFIYPTAYPDTFSFSWPIYACAGVLVGFGTRLGSGCTSGHGVCGISRFSVRSTIATLTFIFAGAVTVLCVRWIGGLS